MNLFSKLSVAVVSFAIATSSVKAADVISSGKIKSIDSDKKTFVFTDPDNKDWTFKMSDSLVINRAGKESKTDLKDGDLINVCYDKGVLAWTANYILITEGGSKNQTLVHGTVKAYNEDKKEVTFTCEGKDYPYAIGNADVRVNMEASKIGDVRVGDKALIIVETVDTVPMVRSIMIERSK